MVEVASRGMAMAAVTVSKADGSLVKHYISLPHVEPWRVLALARRKAALLALVRDLRVEGKVNEFYTEITGHKERRRYA